MYTTIPSPVKVPTSARGIVDGPGRAAGLRPAPQPHRGSPVIGRKDAEKPAARRAGATSRLAWIAGWLLASGCGSCKESAQLQVQAPFPHTRCLARDAPEGRTWQVGALGFEATGRTLTISGATEPVRLAAFAGPGLAAPPASRELAALMAHEPTLAVMLGGLGDDDASASETLRALSEAPFPTLFVPGGRDDPRRLQALLSMLPADGQARVVDLAAMRVVQVGDHQLIPIAGAADGRYALNGHCCGFALADLQAVAAELPDSSGSRFLISWQAPGRGGPHAVARTAIGLDLGSDDLAEFSRRVGAAGGLFAWPTVRVAVPVTADGQRLIEPGQPARDLRMVVPRLTGPPMVTDDGRRAPSGFALLALDREGLRLLELI